MSTSSYSASLRFRAVSSTHFATSSDFRFGRVLPVMIPILSMASILHLLWCYSSAGGNAELLEQLNEGRAFGLREPIRGQVHRRLVNGEYLGRLVFARRRQPNDASPSVACVRLARNQAAGLESIHSRGDRSAGELD